jgi:hypothetical protein
MPKAAKRKRPTRPERARRRGGSSRGAVAAPKRPVVVAAARDSQRPDLHRIDRGQRILEIGSHMISYYMFLSHRLLPLVGEADVAAMAAANSPDRFMGQFNEVRRALLKVVGHHPVLRGKIERMAQETDRLLADAGRYPAGHSARAVVQQEAKVLGQRLREHSRAMSDLLAVLRNI